MGLFKPKWKSNDSYIRGFAVEKLNDQNILAEIAKTDNEWKIRKSALERIDSTKYQDLISSIAKNKQEVTDVREIAICKLTDQQEIAEISVTERDRKLVLAAVRKLELEKWKDLLLSHAKSGTDDYKNDEVSDAAIEKLDHKSTIELLNYLILNENNNRMSQKAINNLSPEQFDNYMFSINLRKNAKKQFFLRNVVLFYTLAIGLKRVGVDQSDDSKYTFVITAIMDGIGGPLLIKFEIDLSNINFDGSLINAEISDKYCKELDRISNQLSQE